MSSSIPSCRVAASFAPLLPRAWHEGQHRALRNRIGVTGPSPAAVEKPATVLVPPPKGLLVSGPRGPGGKGEGLDDEEQLYVKPYMGKKAE